MSKNTNGASFADRLAELVEGVSILEQASAQLLTDVGQSGERLAGFRQLKQIRFVLKRLKGTASPRANRFLDAPTADAAVPEVAPDTPAPQRRRRRNADKTEEGQSVVLATSEEPDNPENE